MSSVRSAPLNRISVDGGAVRHCPWPVQPPTREPEKRTLSQDSAPVCRRVPPLRITRTPGASRTRYAREQTSFWWCVNDDVDKSEYCLVAARLHTRMSLLKYSNAVPFPETDIWYTRTKAVATLTSETSAAKGLNP